MSLGARMRWVLACAVIGVAGCEAEKPPEPPPPPPVSKSSPLMDYINAENRRRDIEKHGELGVLMREDMGKTEAEYDAEAKAEGKRLFEEGLKAEEAEAQAKKARKPHR